MKKKICILTTAHPIDDVRVYHKIACSLAHEFELVWIGPDIYYFENNLQNDGIKRILFRNNKGLIGRLLNNYKVMKIFLRQKNIEYVYMPDPELAFLFSFFFRRLRKSKSIFDIHEVFHKDLLNRKVKGFLFVHVSKLVERLIKRVVSKTHLTIGVSEKVLNYYVSNKKPYFLVRSCLSQNFIEYNAVKLKKNIFTIVHGKNHPARGTLKVLEAIKILKEKDIECKVLMIEQEVFNNDFFKNYVCDFDLSGYIEVHKGLPFAEMQNLMARCHAGIIAYGRDLGVDSLPNRFFEYMAIGIPVIIPSFSKEMVNIVKKEQCGIFVDTEDPKEIAEAIEYLIRNPKVSKEMGENGKLAFLSRHNWEIEIRPLINYLQLSL